MISKNSEDDRAAYNNICAVYNGLHEWDNAIRACSKALELNPNFRLAKNNLSFAQKHKAAEVQH